MKILATAELEIKYKVKNAELEIKYKVKNADGILADAEYKIKLKY